MEERRGHEVDVTLPPSVIFSSEKIDVLVVPERERPSAVASYERASWGGPVLLARC